MIVLLTREEVENENLLGHVEDHIHLERATNINATVEELAESLHTVLRLNNNRTRRIRYNNQEIEPITARARRISYMSTLAEAAVEFNDPRIDDAPDILDDLETITTVDITDLDEVTPRQCERLVRRSLARQGQQAQQ